jgi:opacity protein-like surface antigen
MNTQTIQKTMLACAFCFGAFTCRAAFTEGFIRPAAWYLDYTEAEMPSKAGASLAAGARFGEIKQHELSLEVARASWSWDHLSGLAPGFMLGRSSSGHLTPVLVNYRYYFGAADSRFIFFMGGSAGVTKVSGNVQVVLSGPPSYGSSLDKTQATWSGTVGVTAKLTMIMSVELSYRYLQTQGFEVSSRLATAPGSYAGSAGPTIHFPDTSAHAVALGLKIKL